MPDTRIINTQLRDLTMDTVFKQGHKELQVTLAKYLKSIGRKIMQTNDFLYSPGSFPVMLVAHMDTVHTQPPTICKSADGKTWMAPEGIGGDDRCGIWIILNIIEKYHCSVLFTQDEEIGMLGAKAFTRAKKSLPNVNYMVQLDRQGADDAVFYNCGNIEFIDFVLETTGHIEFFGTFSDISTLSPHFDIASVNLSCGYHSPHTHAEYIKLDEMANTQQAVERMLEATAENPKRKYDYQVSYYAVKPYKNGWKNYGTYNYDDYDDYTGYGAYGSSRGHYAYGNYDHGYGTSKKGKTVTYSYNFQDKEKPEDAALVKAYEDDVEQKVYDETEKYLQVLLGMVPEYNIVDDVAYLVTETLIDNEYYPIL